MNLRLFLLVCVISTAQFHPVLGRDFANLDFEAATPPNTGPYDPLQLFPEWIVGNTLYPGGTSVVYNKVSLGASCLSLLGQGQTVGFGYSPLQGAYSALLKYGFSGNPTLSQTGLIPANAQSISLMVGRDSSAAYAGAAVALNGVNIPLTLISGGRLAGDISSFAGSEAQLTISTLGLVGYGEVFFDDIQFSVEAVPEPSTLSLLSISILFLCWQKRAA